MAAHGDGCEIRYGSRIAQGNADLLEIMALMDEATGPGAAQRSANLRGCAAAEVYRIATDTFARLRQAGFDFVLPDSLRAPHQAGRE